MAIFPHAEVEATVQVNDKTRIDVTKSFTSPDEAAVTMVEIEPETSNGYIDVFSTKQSDWYLDWEYATDGTKTVSVRITTDGVPVTETYSMEVLTEADDMLFSSDQDIVSIEPNLLKFNGGAARDGRNTFLDIHREAQKEVLDYINERGYRNTDDSPVTKDQLVVIEDINKWSKYLTLAMIYRGVSNAIDDVFDQKSTKYMSMANDARNRATLRIDFDKDTAIASDEIKNFQSVELVRR